MLDGVRMAGGMAPIGASAPVAVPRPEVAPPVVPPVDVERPAPIGADAAEAQAVQAFTGHTLGTGFQELPPASDRDVYQFFARSGPQAARSVIRSGDSLVIAVGDHVIKAQLSQLEAALSRGQIDKTSPLVQSLQVYEAAYNAGLPNSAANAIVKA